MNTSCWKGDAGESKRKTARLKHPLLHHNVESLSHYIRKHDEYSNWEARVWLAGRFQRQRSIAVVVRIAGPAPPLAAQEVLRDARIAHLVLSSTNTFFAMGFLDGVPGLIYCGLQGVQFFHIKAKIYELKRSANRKERT